MPPRASAAPRSPRRTPSGRATSRTRKTIKPAAEPAPMRGRLTSDEEKRELILAHSAMRRARDPVQLMSVWAGVAASAAVVFIAWAWVFVPNVMSALRSPVDPGTQELLNGVDQAREHAATYHVDRSVLEDQIRRTSAEVDAYARRAASQQQALDAMSAMMGGATSTNERSDLFAPTASSSSETKSP